MTTTEKHAIDHPIIDLTTSSHQVKNGTKITLDATKFYIQKIPDSDRVGYCLVKTPGGKQLHYSEPPDKNYPDKIRY